MEYKEELDAPKSGFIFRVKGERVNEVVWEVFGLIELEALVHYNFTKRFTYLNFSDLNTSR
jgi:hypothetical protein